MEPVNDTPTGFMLSPVWYDRARFLVQIVLPAFATFYLTIGDTLDLPATDKVAAVTVALTTFLGVILGLSRKNYNNSDAQFVGEITVQQKAEGGLMYTLEYKGDPADLANMDTAKFKVGPTLPPPGG